MRIRSIILSLLIVLPLLAPGAVSAYVAGEYEPIVPQLQVDIPGLTDDDFKGSVIIGSNQTREECTPGKVCIGTISIYINAVFKFMVTAGIIMSIVIIMIGGIEYMIGSAAGSIEKAKKHITGAVIGLALLLAATSIVTFINPSISGLQSLELTILKHIPPPPTTVLHDTTYGTSMQTDLIRSDGEIIKGGSPLKGADGERVRSITLGNGDDNVWMHEDLVIKIQGVADVLNGGNPEEDFEAGALSVLEDALTEQPRHSKLEILKTYQSPKKSAAEFYRKCIINNCADDPVCNPFPDDSLVEGTYKDGFTFSAGFKDEIKDLQEGEILELLGNQAMTNTGPTCPFQTGYAIAAVCQDDSPNSALATCQLHLEKLMKQRGFCRSYYRPWIYEFKGKQVLDGTKNCDWIPGTMIPFEPSACTGVDAAVGPTITYAPGKSSNCAREYGANCSDAGMRWRDRVDLTSGKCD